jgi:5-methylcytosine-specific restriction protein A
MNILDYYKLKNQSPEWVVEYQSTSTKKSGKTFAFYTTNFRSINSFYDIFKKFEGYINLPRQQWELTNLKQEKAKQWIVNLTQSKLYSKKNGFFVFSNKGKVYKKLINSNLNFDEKWIINLIFLIDSYFDNKPNYLIHKINEFNKKLIESNYQLEQFYSSLKEAILRESYYTEDLFKLRVFWTISFYKDSDFQPFIQNSTQEDLNKISNYVENERRKINSNDCIGHKFKNSGQYNANSFLDDMKLIYIINFIIQNNILTGEFDFFVEKVINEYMQIRRIDKENILNFINQEKEVFQDFFDEIRGIKSLIFDDNDESTPPSNLPSNSTSELIITGNNPRTVQIETYRRVSSILKKQAKELTSYNCFLKELNNCRYFTSKQNSKNYLEIHHLIPIEFSNDFEVSLDFVDNYIPLCPHCHRLLHFGEDRERKASLTFLFNKRINLILKYIKDFDLTTLFSYYEVSN